jgi:hypothetical protein
MSSSLVKLLVVVALLSGNVFAHTQTIFLNHSSALCTSATGGGKKLIGTWFNAAGCQQTTSVQIIDGLVCTDNETVGGPQDCHFFFCCCYQQTKDNDSRTIDNNCSLGSISAQVTTRNVCDN